MGKAFTLSVDEKKIARLVFDLEGEKVNKFSTSVMEELDNVLHDLGRKNGVKALVVESGKPGMFIAGADIKELEVVKNEAEGVRLARGGQDVFNRLEDLPFPTIAVIDGACVGGGLEFALACTYRITTDNPKVRIGLPEVQLGLVPGWGGTQRLPRLIGLQQGVEMVLTGKVVPGAKAYKMGIVDAITPSEFLDEAVNRFVAKILEPKGKKKVLARRKKGGLVKWLLEGNPLGRKLFFRMALKNVMAKTHGQYPAPLKALEVIQKTFTMHLKDGLSIEADAIASLANSEICKNLIQLFFTQEAMKKSSGTAIDFTPDLSKIERVGVIGAGTMGGGIAWLFSRKGHPVRVKDVTWDALTKAFQAAAGIYKALVKKRKVKRNEANLAMHRITGTTDYSGLETADVIVEAIVENIEIKKKVFQELEEVVRSDTIICSNTSGLSITEMASSMKHPERFVGMHFFNPVNRMPLVEIIPGEKTSPETIATIVAVTRKLGKTPVVVTDCAGFLVNRVLIPCLNEAGWLLQEGVDQEKIDRCSREFGMPMGPFVLADEVGVDVASKVSGHLEESYGQRMAMPKIFETMVGHKFFGKKTGAGFYLHNGSKKPKPNSKVRGMLPKQKKAEGEMSDEEIQDRLILIMVNEAAKCLEEEVSRDPAFIDMAMIMGTGFPPFRGGLLRYADNEGIDNVVNRLEGLAKENGERFMPAGLLQTMKENGRKFYNEVGV